ncbi:MAG TPA: Ig-like domain-containing protein [Polyangiaceae bacterium]|nr:Ig-like domain-containing protein [Polyangiaceae bacterium]
MPAALAESTGAFDPNTPLKEIAISGPASMPATGDPSTFTLGGASGDVGAAGTTLVAEGIYEDGSVHRLENVGPDLVYRSNVTWTSSDPSIAAVASGDPRTAGGIQGFRPGTVTITATLGNVSKSGCFVVTEPEVTSLLITGVDYLDRASPDSADRNPAALGRPRDQGAAARCRERPYIEPYHAVWQYVSMAAVRKITANIPADALSRAQRLTGKGLTATLIEALAALERESKRTALRRLRGRVSFDLDLEKTRR